MMKGEEGEEEEEEEEEGVWEVTAIEEVTRVRLCEPVGAVSA